MAAGWWLGCSVLLVIALEITLRSKGYQPWLPETVDHVRVVPGGRLFEADPHLGYVLLPGRFDVHLSESYSFRMSHGPDRLRLTRPPDASVEVSAPEIWLFGCSFTHGWSLNDEETFAWKLQHELPQSRVRNFGVTAYGTAQNLLQFRQALKTRPAPAAVVVVYGSFHDMRNTYVRAWRKSVAVHDRLGIRAWPYARFDSGGELQFHWGQSHFAELPFMRTLALGQWLDERFNALEESHHRSHDVSRALIREFARECVARKIEFLVAGITPDQITEGLLSAFQTQGIDTVDIAVDFSLPKYSNLPHDFHPSPAANDEYARRLEPRLRKWLSALKKD